MHKLKLKAGNIIKNYIELCELLDVKPTKSKGREYHIKEFERYCNYHKAGQKFIIDEVYDTPIEKTDGRKNNGGHIGNTTYEDLMDKLLINMLYDMGDIDITFNELFSCNIPLFTKNYKELLENGYKDFAQKHKMSKGLVLTYQQKIRNIVVKCFETALNRLQKNGVITWRKNIKFTNSQLEQDFADEQLTKDIKDAENLIYEEMNITHFDRINPKINKKFKTKVCKQLDNVISYWNVYSIEILDENIQETEDDLDELIIRFVKSVHKAVSNKKCKNDFGEVFYPYTNLIHQEDARKLNKLIWELPKEYVDEEELNIDESLETAKENDNEESFPF